VEQWGSFVLSTIAGVNNISLHFFFNTTYLWVIWIFFVLAKISHQKHESHKFDKESLSAIAFKSSSGDK